MFLLTFPRKQDLTFMANCLIGECMSIRGLYCQHMPKFRISHVAAHLKLNKKYRENRESLVNMVK